jgi:KTSC domain
MPNKLPIPPLVPVESSNLEAVGYAAEGGLFVRFRAHAHSPASLYHYPEVTAQEHTELMKAPSLGKHFAAHIKAHHKAERLS